MGSMSKSTISNTKERTSAEATSGASPYGAGDKMHATPAPATKTKLEKTQSMLTVISTSIGLLGMAGSVFAMGLATFYTGAVEVRPDMDANDVVVKVYTKEGHESVYHTKHIELMPGSYHLEISSDGRVVHTETKIRFHKTNNIPVHFPRAAQSQPAPTPTPNTNPITAMFAPAATNSPAQNTSVQAQVTQSNPSAPQSAAPAKPTAAQQLSFARADLGEAGNASNTSANNKKRRWWQVWKRSAAEADETDQLE